MEYLFWKYIVKIEVEVIIAAKCVAIEIIGNTEIIVIKEIINVIVVDYHPKTFKIIVKVIKKNDLNINYNVKFNSRK